MKVVDTTFLIDVLRGNKDTLKVLGGKDQLLTTQINMYEVIRGLFLKNISLQKIVETNEMFESIRVLSLDDGSILKSAEISADLIKRGETISDCDCLTAGIALNNHIKHVVTRNLKHFSRIKGIKAEVY